MREFGVKPRILVVEDDSDIAMALSDDLSIEGFDVEIARDGEDALRRLTGERWDLVVLDVMMPLRDGFEVCRQARRRGFDAPVIFLTAKGDEFAKLRGFEIGGDDYLVKPFSPSELRARIKALLRRSRATLSGYTFGHTEVDFGRAEVRVNGSVIPITATELRLLETFVKRRGCVVTREQLIDEVWGLHANVTERAVDAHIVNLRKKVESSPESPEFIVSVRGIGYRFDG